MPCREAHAPRGILAIDGDEIQLPLCAQLWEALGHGGMASAPHDIPKV
jgi:hypothetical protein